MLNRERHEIILKQILRDVYKNSLLQGRLGFKGGTCLYIFYDLSRFSTDLDFNLKSDDFDPKELDMILSRYLKIEDYSAKKNTYFWLGSFEKGSQKIKVEVSKRKYPDKYVNKNFYGIMVSTLDQNYMFAHKLCAITDRPKVVNRDLFDTWFMFNKKWDVNEEIVKLRTGKSLSEYYKDLALFIERKVKKEHVLGGMGELFDNKMKEWVKNHLIEDLLFELNIRIK